MIHNHRGFSFVEIFVGMMILSTAGTSLMMVSEAVRKHTHAKQRYFARQAAQIALNQLSSNLYLKAPINSEGSALLLENKNSSGSFPVFARDNFDLDSYWGLKEALTAYELGCEVDLEGSEQQGTSLNAEVTVSYRSLQNKSSMNRMIWHGFALERSLPLK
ncbi:MAG: hypothetical protein H3C47_06575 [Candidatus Cloacimonetes bacterium]|nr:hypothetical protein [Candidatus Cloacimonadota bacterium]